MGLRSWLRGIRHAAAPSSNPTALDAFMVALDKVRREYVLVDYLKERGFARKSDGFWYRPKRPTYVEQYTIAELAMNHGFKGYGGSR